MGLEESFTVIRKKRGRDKNIIFWTIYRKDDKYKSSVQVLGKKLSYLIIQTNIEIKISELGQYT